MFTGQDYQFKIYIYPHISAIFIRGARQNMLIGMKKGALLEKDIRCTRIRWKVISFHM